MAISKDRKERLLESIVVPMLKMRDDKAETFKGNSLTARTLSQIFDEWKGSAPSIRWTEHTITRNAFLARQYLDAGWWLIPLGEKSKKPQNGAKGWNEKSLDYDQAVSHLARRGNLGVVARLSSPRMSLLDYDDEILPEQMERAARLTLTSTSPNGYHIFTRGKPNRALFEKLKAKFPALDMLRADIQYVTVPPSQTCRHEHVKHLCEQEKTPHDYRVLEWIDINAPILSFTEFAKLCLR